MRKQHACTIAMLLVAGIAGTAGFAAAQTYPTRPVMIVVPFAAGGGNDMMARLLAQHMGRALGQQFVIENRAGAGGTLGARAVAKAAPDGYTLMVGHSGVFGVAPSLYANPGYDPRKDFAPIGLIASFQQILVVHPSLPVHNVADLMALARKEPGKITYATAGIGSGSHISTELFTSMADIKLTHVPYRGSGADAGRSRRRPCRHDGDHDSAVGDRANPRRPPARRSRSPATSACRSFPTCRPSPNPACPATWR